MTIINTTDVEVEKKVEQLKARFNGELKPSMNEDLDMFQRFLKARDFDLDEAEKMLRKHIEWRKKFEVDTILEKEFPFKDLQEYFFQIKIGLDKEHRPVRYVAAGNIDIKGYRMSMKFVDRLKFIIRILEEETACLENQRRKLGKKPDGIRLIIDMKDFSFAKATDKGNIEEAINVLRLFQDNYPERLHSAIFINATSYFAIAFAMLKNFISATILNKLHIYGAEDEWKPILLKSIDADLLPEFLGGKRNNKGEYPHCQSFIKHKGIIPTSYYICKSARSLAKSKDSKKLTIPRASFSEIKLLVKEPGSVIEWEFETKTRDIGFGLFLSEEGMDGEEKITELVPLLRLDTEEFSETGMYKCEKAGTYVILFDNSYSWVRAKEIYYRATVVSLKEHENQMTSS